MDVESYDVVVIGAGPAGSTAAALLAERQHRVALIDRDRFPRKSTSIGWLNARCLPLLKELGVKEKSLQANPLTDVTFLDGELVKEAKPKFEEPAGYLIDRVTFGNALVAAAKAKGVTILDRTEARDIQLQEASALVNLGEGKQIEGRLLLLASGRGSALLERVGIGRPSSSSIVWTAQIDAAMKSGQGPAKPRVVVVLGLDKRGSFGLCTLLPDRMSISINWSGDHGDATRALIELCKRLLQRKEIPIDVSATAATAKPVPSPAGAALDMDTHVGKHTLLIGDAGRFIAAVSNEGIYPAMWSAKIAVDVADKALSSVHSQDELMAFDSQWRIEMADYLRPPNTDSQFLLPLIFSNQPMADRMGAAFFFGENI